VDIKGQRVGLKEKNKESQREKCKEKVRNRFFSYGFGIRKEPVSFAFFETQDHKKSLLTTWSSSTSFLDLQYLLIHLKSQEREGQKEEPT